MSSGDAISIPDFVVVGGYYELEDGPEVILMASKSLTSVELIEQLRYPDEIFSHFRVLPLEYDMYLTAKMRDYVMIRAKSYPEAWAGLFAMWSPEPAKKREIDGRKQIGS
jgi:hypothetical protein